MCVCSHGHDVFTVASCSLLVTSCSYSFYFLFLLLLLPVSALLVLSSIMYLKGREVELKPKLA